MLIFVDDIYGAALTMQSSCYKFIFYTYQIFTLSYAYMTQL